MLPGCRFLPAFLAVVLCCVGPTLLPATVAPLPIQMDSLEESGPEWALFRMAFRGVRPHLAVTAEQVQLDHRSLVGSIAPLYGARLSLGFDFAYRRYDSSIVSIASSGLDIGYGQSTADVAAAEARAAADPAAVTESVVNLWRFGAQNHSGYGYSFDGTANTYIAFLAGDRFGWAVMDPRVVAAPAADRQALADIGDALRFSETMRATIAVRPAAAVSVNLGYEWQLIYPRHMVLQWMGSHAVEGIASVLVTTFVDHIGVSSPSALPVVHFLLVNGLNAGFKALRQSNMNWPFHSAAPMSAHVLSVGATVHF